MSTDDFFHIIEDVQVVLRNKGIYRQCKVYHRNGKIYAGWGTGFITLMKGSGTSHPNATWERNDQIQEVIGGETVGCIQYQEPKRLTLQAAPAQIEASNDID